MADVLVFTVPFFRLRWFESAELLCTWESSFQAYQNWFHVDPYGIPRGISRIVNKSRKRITKMLEKCRKNRISLVKLRLILPKWNVFVTFPELITPRFFFFFRNSLGFLGNVNDDQKSRGKRQKLPRFRTLWPISPLHDVATTFPQIISSIFLMTRNIFLLPFISVVGGRGEVMMNKKAKITIWNHGTAVAIRLHVDLRLD